MRIFFWFLMRRNEKNLSRNWVWRTPGEWLENMLDFGEGNDADEDALG